jgi:hypothetical protein
MGVGVSVTVYLIPFYYVRTFLKEVGQGGHECASFFASTLSGPKIDYPKWAN